MDNFHLSSPHVVEILQERGDLPQEKKLQILCILIPKVHTISVRFFFFKSHCPHIASRIDKCDLWDLVLACGCLLGSVNEMD